MWPVLERCTARLGSAGLGFCMGLWLLALAPARAQDSLAFIWHNAENLFDTLDAPGPGDDAFTPLGAQQWTQGRYTAKLDSLASLYRRLADELGVAPALVGLAEVEQDAAVLAALQARLPWARHHALLHAAGSDARGLQVACLLDTGRIRLQAVHTLPIHFPWAPGHRTRAMLYLSGLLPTGQALALYLAHWPSRYQDSTYRQQAARVLRHHLDSVLLQAPTTQVLILGDLNDEPHNASLRLGLGAVAIWQQGVCGNSPEEPPFMLFDMNADGPEAYTYLYQGRGELLDHALTTDPASLMAWNAGQRQLLRQGRDGPYMHRTYWGTHYAGGMSDHLPIVGKMFVK